jgi:hypothetical protein
MTTILTLFRLLIVTALRLKALHLASSTDYTYSKSYLGLLSSIGCMLGVVLCGMISVPTVVRSAMKFFHKLAVLQNMDWNINKQLESTSRALRALYTRKDKTSAIRRNVHKTPEFLSPTLSSLPSAVAYSIDEDLDDEDGTRAYEHRARPFGPLENSV